MRHSETLNPVDPLLRTGWETQASHPPKPGRQAVTAAATAKPLQAVIDEDAAKRHLECIGFEDTDRLILNLYPPKDGPCIQIPKPGEQADATVDDLPGLLAKAQQILQRPHCEKHNLGVYINDGGTKKDQIEHCRVIVAESDSGISEKEQLNALKVAGLPDPSVVVRTGGKSLHFYWTLAKRCTPSQYEDLTKRVRFALEGQVPEGGWDTGLHKPNQVMRLAGGCHPKTGKKTEIISSTGELFDFDELSGYLPELPETKTSGTYSYETSELPYNRRKPAEQIAIAIDALKHCPKRGEPGSNTYNQALHWLAALRNEFGVDTAKHIVDEADWEGDYWDASAKIESLDNPQKTIWSLFDCAVENGWKQPWPRDRTQQQHQELQRRQKGLDEGLAAVDPETISSLDDLLGCAEEGKLRKPRKDKLTAVISIVLPLEYNQLTGRIENNSSEVEGDFLDTLYLQLAEKFQLDVSKATAADAALVAARRRSYHPVRDYLNGLNTQLSKADWEQIAHRCFDNVSPAAQVFLQRQLIGLVARALNPGCKLDTALVIHSSRQGIGKSTFWSVLGGDWFSDSLGNLTNLKDDIITLHSAWIHEWGEIDSVMGRSASEALKKFLSARRDDVRKPYGRGIESLQRSCGIVGTTNRDDFIKDPTGNRRFPVFSVKQVNLAWVEKNRDAIWGSALAAYRNGDPWHYNHAENELITQTAAQFAADDPIFDAVQTWIEDNPEKKQVATPVLVFFIDRDRLNDRELGRQVANSMRRLGWERCSHRAKGYLPNGDRHNTATIWIKPGST